MAERVLIRPYLPGDADATIGIFLLAIREVASKDYSPEQVDAWARVDDRNAWAARRASRPAWMAELDGRPIGFADLVPDGLVDMMFVHPRFQGLGAASLLLRQVEQQAGALGLDRIHTEASITARPFFERRGFVLVQEQMVEKRGQWFRNFRMEKALAWTARR